MIEDEIRALEHSLLTPAVRSSAEKLDHLLSDDFVEFGSSRCAYTKAQVIRLVLANTVVPMPLLGFRATLIAPGIAHTTYRAGGSLRSSLWRREGDRWRMLLHQGTPISPGAAVCAAL